MGSHPIKYLTNSLEVSVVPGYLGVRLGELTL